MKNKILITGSKGYIGKQIAKKLSNLNFNVYGIGRGEWKKIDYQKCGYKKNINGNISEKNLSKYKIEFDLIIHCAGSGLVGFNKKIDYSNNVSSTKYLIKYIKKYQKNIKLIFMSSYSVYGNNYKNQITESFKLNPKSVYALNKKKAEDLLLKSSIENNFKLIILRIASLYGRGLKKQLIYDACKKFYSNDAKFYGTGNEKRDFIHISDLIKVVIYFCRNNFTNINIINCGSGKSYKIKKVLEIISNKLKFKNKIKFSKKKLNTNPLNLILNIDKLKNLKLRPNKKFEVGVNDYINWFKKQI